MRTRGHRELTSGGFVRGWNARSERVVTLMPARPLSAAGKRRQSTRSECAFHLEEFYDAG